MNFIKKSFLKLKHAEKYLKNHILLLLICFNQEKSMCESGPFFFFLNDFDFFHYSWRMLVFLFGWLVFFFLELNLLPLKTNICIY